MKKAIIYTVGLCCLLFSACKKEYDRTRWDIDVLVPVIHASLSMQDIIADTLLQTNADGSLSLIFEESFYDLKTDSIYTIPDTSISNIVVWPLFSSPIQPGQNFYSTNNKIALGVSNVQLTKALMRGGTIGLELKNTLPTKVIYTYSIPKAKKGGVPFSIVQSVDAAGSSGPGTFNGTYSLSDYELDLTGPNGTDFNTIYYNVKAVADSAGTVFTINTNDIVINLKSNLLDLDPLYVKGYLGQNSISENSFTTTGLGNYIKSGMIQLDSMSMDIDIKNYIGADGRIFFNNLSALNDKTGNVVSLNASSIMNRPLNINRARESGPAPSPVIASNHNYHLDNANSNIKAFMENLPDRISYDVNFDLNPLGNTFSLYTDFLYSDFLVDGKIKIKMPFRFAANNLALADTQDISLGGLTNLDPLGPMTLTLVATNGFPLDFNLQLLIMDSNRVITDSLLIPDRIPKANTDAQYKVTSPQVTRIEVPVDQKRKDHILQSKFMGIRAVFNTPDYAQLIQIYSSHRLDLKLIADGTYYIR